MGRGGKKGPQMILDFVDYHNHKEIHATNMISTISVILSPIVKLCINLLSTGMFNIRKFTK